MDEEGAMPSMVSGVMGIMGLIGKGNMVVLLSWRGCFVFLVEDVWLLSFFWAGESAKRTCKGADEPVMEWPLYFSITALAD